MSRNEERRELLDSFLQTGKGLQGMKDIVINKIQSIQRCVERAREEFHDDPATFDANYTRQDAAILNVLRACEQASQPEFLSLYSPALYGLWFSADAAQKSSRKRIK